MYRFIIRAYGTSYSPGDSVLPGSTGSFIHAQSELTGNSEANGRRIEAAAIQTTNRSVRAFSLDRSTGECTYHLGIGRIDVSRR